MLVRTPALLGASAVVMQGYELLMGSAFATEAGNDPDTDLHSRLLATVLVNGNSRAFIDHLEAGTRDDLIARLVAVIDHVEEHFRR